MDIGYMPPAPPPLDWPAPPQLDWSTLPPPPPPEAPPPSPRSQWFWLMVTGITVVVLGAGGAGIAFAVHHTLTVRQVHTSPATGSSGSTSVSVGEWFTSVSTDYSAVESDWGTIGGLGGSDLTGIIAACTQLDTDTQTLQSDAPMPDPAMNAVYQDALTNSAEFATGCVSATTDLSPTELEAAEQFETKALSDFDQLDGLIGVPVSSGQSQ